MAPHRGVAVPALSTERRSLLLLALLTLLPFAALAAWARLSSPAPWEPRVLDAISLQEGPLGVVIGAINTLGNLPYWSVLVLVCAGAVWLVRGARAAVLVGASLAADLAAFAVKIIVERQRPDTAATDHFFGPDSFAFPSGHVVRAVALLAAIAWVLAPPGLRFRLALVVGVLGGLVMGYARVALGVHWPTDALGGVLLGLAWFAISTSLATRSAVA